MAKKCTNTEADQRVNAVYDLLLRAHSRTQIIRFASDSWGVGDRQAEIYMARARQLMALDAELERPQWLTAAVARLQPPSLLPTAIAFECRALPLARVYRPAGPSHSLHDEGWQEVARHAPLYSSSRP